MRGANVWEANVCPAMQVSRSDEKAFSGNSSLPGIGPLSNFFR